MLRWILSLLLAASLASIAWMTASDGPSERGEPIRFSAADGIHEAPFSCRSDGGEVLVSPIEGDVVLRTDLDVQGISRLAPRRVSPLGVGQGASTGLTSVSYGTRTRIGTRRFDRDGVGCVLVDRVEIDLGFLAPIDVYVASQLVPGTCPYQAVRDHEATHVALYRKALRDGVRTMQAEVRDVLAGMGWRYTAQDESSALSGVESVVAAVVDRSLARISAIADEANSRIDTRDSYAALNRSCDDWPPFR